MRVFDVSLPVTADGPLWPGDAPTALEQRFTVAKDGASVSELRVGTHTGTHVDAPAHFLEGGSGVDVIPLDALLGEVFVGDATGFSDELDADQLLQIGIPEGTTRLFIKTSNSERWRKDPTAFFEDYVCLAPEGAEWLVERGIRTLGVDALSVEVKGAPGHPVHHLLLRSGIVIIEGLDLSQIDPGVYDLLCAPLRIVGADGSPARVLLLETGAAVGRG